MITFAGKTVDWWPDLGAQDAHLWLISLEHAQDQLVELSALLCPEELERARKFYRKQHRDNYVAGRGALRSILARYAGIEPRELQFGYSAKGKPYLLGPGHQEEIQFNLSHSEGWALCGVARHLRIGVDIEWKRPEIDMLGVARNVFSPVECAALAGMEERQRIDWFYRIWTSKEAFLKALGAGITEWLSDVEVRLGCDGQAVLNWSLPSLGKPADWQLREFCLPEGFQCAAVIESPLSAWFEGVWEYRAF